MEDCSQSREADYRDAQRPDYNRGHADVVQQISVPPEDVHQADDDDVEREAQDLGERAARDEREQQLQSSDQQPIVFFEASKRIQKTLDWISEQYPDHQMVIAKEISKTFERIWYSYEQWRTDTQADPSLLKGEWVFAIYAQKNLYKKEVINK